jgi:RNA polymerase sigma-70 factor (subfamily 1)
VPSLDGWDLKRYRAYLKVRARMLDLDPRLRVRFDESDLVQEVFVRAQACAESCRGQSHRERMAYLDQVFDNVFTDYLREHRAQKRDIDMEVAEQALNESSAAYRLHAADSVSPSEQASRREESLRATAALDQLPAHERDVLIVIHLQQHSLKEAADRLGMSKGKVAGIYGRGMIRLRSLLNAGDGKP